MSRISTGRACGVLLSLACAGPIGAQQLILAHGEATELAQQVWSTLEDTWVENDGLQQSLSEAITGGKRSDRTSRLVHDWFFDVPAASGVTLLLRAARTPDRENFVFFASIDGGQSYEPLPEIYVQSSGMTSFEATLPSVPAGGGPIRIRVEDEQSAEWATTSDSVHVDYLALRVSPPGAPAAPTGVVASSKSPSTMFVGWTDTLDEDGYRIERFDGVSWTPVGQTGAGGTFFVDEGLAPSTSYGYRVIAFNSRDASDPSGAAIGTTRAIGDFAAELVSDGPAERAEHRVDALGAVHLVLWDRLLYASRAPQTGTWQFENLPANPAAIDVAGDGTIGIALLRRVADDVQEILFIERRPGSITWDPPVLVDSGKIGILGPGCLRYDSSGRPAVTYTTMFKSRGYYRIDLGFAQRVAGAWRTMPVRTDELWISGARLAFDDADRPRIAHVLGLPGQQNWRAGSSAVSLARWLDDPVSGAWDDATWQLEQVAAGATNGLGEVQLAFDAIAGDDVLAWSRRDAPVPFVQVARRIAGSWSIRTLADGWLIDAPALAVDAAGAAHVSYATPDNRTRYATDASGVWSAVEVDALGLAADLQLDAAGAVSLVYRAWIFPDGPLAMFLARR